MQIQSDGMPYPSHPFYMPLRVISLSGITNYTASNISSTNSSLMMIWDGKGFLEIDGKIHKVMAGSLIALSSSSLLKMEPELQLKGIWIEYSCILQSKNEDIFINDNSPVHHASTRLIALAGELYSAWIDADKQKPFRVQQLFTQFIVELHGELTSHKERSSSWMERVTEYIEAHYNEDITRDQMAALAEVSPEHFSRTFRKSIGLSFSAYITLLRIRKAQQRILTSSPNLTTLAHEVGYEEGTYLSRKFKQLVGVSPTAYQNKNKRVVALNYNHTASLRVLEIMPQLGVYSEWQHSLEQVPASKQLQMSEGKFSLLYDSVAAVKPDVIIGYSLPDNKILTPVAPVIELPFMQMSWREQFALIAEVVNRRQRAEQWLSHYDRLCLTANGLLNHAIGMERGTAIVWEVSSRSAYCFSSSFGRGCQILYGDLGFKPPSVIIEKGITDSGYLEASIEDIVSFPADHIIITSIPSSSEGRQRFTRLLHSKAWKQLDAVRNGRVYILNQADMFYGFDPLSSQAQLQELLRVMTS
ncbi:MULTISPECIES: AraC family transcriptional regulator [Paenibacillus]|uniref:AraC family transcriptional regulator n=1 Tax=Paenibacillus TaxID=44249 RepID=UPI0009D6E403|nr:AraC family transcriptional regulator [Paenibacillus odorifer]